MQRQGQLNLGCTNCHDDNSDKQLAGSPITQAHPTGYPIYRLEWQSLGSLQRRLRACITGIRAQAYDYGAPELVDLELYLMSRARGMQMEAPAIGSDSRKNAEESEEGTALIFGRMRLALRERLLDHELRRLAVIALDKSLARQKRARIRHQRRAAADHDAVVRGI